MIQGHVTVITRDFYYGLHFLFVEGSTLYCRFQVDPFVISQEHCLSCEKVSYG